MSKHKTHRIQFTLSRFLCAVVPLAISAALLAMLIRHGTQQGWFERPIWLILIGLTSSLGTASGVLKNGHEGFVLGAIAGGMVGILFPFIVIVCFTIHNIAFGDGPFALPN